MEIGIARKNNLPDRGLLILFGVHHGTDISVLFFTKNSRKLSGLLSDEQDF